MQLVGSYFHWHLCDRTLKITSMMIWKCEIENRLIVKHYTWLTWHLDQIIIVNVNFIIIAVRENIASFNFFFLRDFERGEFYNLKLPSVRRLSSDIRQVTTCLNNMNTCNRISRINGFSAYIAVYCVALHAFYLTVIKLCVTLISTY